MYTSMFHFAMLARSKKPCVGVLQSSQRDGQTSPALRALTPVHVTCSGSPVSTATYLDLELLQFFVLSSAKSNCSAKQVIKSNNYADVLRVGPSSVLLQFLIILS